MTFRQCCCCLQLYHDLSRLFVDHQELIDDFAAFMLPQQAFACGCYMLHQQYLKSRTFLRKLEVTPKLH